MLGNFDGWKCLGKVLARLHAAWAGLGRVLGNYLGLMHGKSVPGVPTKRCLRIVVPIIPWHTTHVEVDPKADQFPKAQSLSIKNHTPLSMFLSF